MGKFFALSRWGQAIPEVLKRRWQHLQGTQWDTTRKHRELRGHYSGLEDGEDAMSQGTQLQDLGQVRKCVLPYSLPRRSGLVDTPVSASETYFRQSICVALGAEFVMIHYGSNRKRIYLFIPSSRFLRAGTLLAHLL